MRALSLCLLLLLASCAERWERPGSSEGDGDAANAACTDRAQLAVPVQLAWQIVAPARIEREQRCWMRGGREYCQVYDRYRPAQWGQVDVNTGARDAWRRTCLRDQGFVFQGYRPLRLD